MIFQEKTHYIGAVVDYAAKFDKSLTPAFRISANLLEYEKYIREAAGNVSSIIFSRYSDVTSRKSHLHKGKILLYYCIY